MVWTINEKGWICGDASITQMPRPKIEHGALLHVNGIIVHQTDSPTARATLNAYSNGGAGAHFLIDRDGNTYQVASLKKKTWHVGKLRAKCVASHTCSKAEFKLFRDSTNTEIYHHEMHKSVPVRLPSNEDSVGIELVARCILDAKYIKPDLTTEDIQKLTANFGVFETVTPAQNTALDVLIQNIQASLHVPVAEVYSHPEVSMKNITEASSAQWPGRK